MFRLFWIAVFCLVYVSGVFAEQTDCYVAIESSGSYDELTVMSISLTMLRQFVDSNVQQVPMGGFNDKGCVYRINVTEQATGIKVFIFGPKISDYGDSQLRGEPGLEQAVLRGIYKSLEVKTDSICKKYGSVLENECETKSTTTVKEGGDGMQAGSGQGMNQGSGAGNINNDRRIPPDCQKKEGVKLPDKCRMFYEGEQGEFKVPPDCQRKPGVKLPDKCRMFYEGGPGQGPGPGPGQRRIPPDCRKKVGKKLPQHCKKFYENRRPPRRK